MKKFTNARICRQHNQRSEILVAKGVIRQIGKNLPKADEENKIEGRLVAALCGPPPAPRSRVHCPQRGRRELVGYPLRRHPARARGQENPDAGGRQRVCAEGRPGERFRGVSGSSVPTSTWTIPKLTGLKAMLEIREELKDSVTIQIVAFRRRACTPTKAATR